MTIQTEETLKVGDLNIHLIPSRTYKTITMELFFRGVLDRKTITERVVLPFVLKKGTANYPDTTLLQDRLDDLYGAALQIGSWKNGPYHLLNFHLECPNERFVPGGGGLIEDALALLKEVVFNPLLEDGRFPEETVSREKRSIGNQIASMQDDKMTYANERLLDIMCEGEPESIHGYGYTEDIPKIDGGSLYECYRKMLAEDRMDLFVVGNFDHAFMEAAIRDAFGHGALPERNGTAEAAKPSGERAAAGREVVEKDDIQQAKLHIGYRTNTTYDDEDFAAMMVYSMILGGYSGSKLFENVREKNSLAYYVSASPDLYGGKLYVYSGISPDDYQKAAAIIDGQFAAMEQGDFTEEELELAKMILTSNIRQSLDSAVGMIDLHYRQVIGGNGGTPEETILKIGKVDSDDVIRAARKVEKDTTFLLTAKEGAVE